jgi:hypothetical protein
MWRELAVTSLRFVGATVCVANVLLFAPLTLATFRSVAERPSEPLPWAASVSALAVTTLFFAGACRCCMSGRGLYTPPRPARGTSERGPAPYLDPPPDPSRPGPPPSAETVTRKASTPQEYRR